jgi:hypothetical protein
MATSTHVTRYEGPTRTKEAGGKLYLFDAGTDEIIAEFSADAADEIRHSHPTTLTYDGHGHVTKAHP